MVLYSLCRRCFVHTHSVTHCSASQLFVCVCKQRATIDENSASIRVQENQQASRGDWIVALPNPDRPMK